MMGGTSITIPAFCAAVELQAQTVMAPNPPTTIPPDVIFLTLADEKDLLAAPPADMFVAIWILDLPVWQSVVSGALSLPGLRSIDGTGLDAKIKVGVYCRMNADQELRATTLYTDTTIGIMQLVNSAISAFQGWTFPVASDPTEGYLREQCRLVSGPTLRTARYVKAGAESTLWAMANMVFEAKFGLTVT